MKKLILKKCMMALGLSLFFTIIPMIGNGGTVYASEVNTEQNDIKLNVKSKAIVKEKTYALKLYNIKENHKVSFKSDSDLIASVDERGVITAVEYGVAIITATVKDGLKTIATLECEVTVGPPAISVKLTKSELTLKVGEKTSLIAILKPNNTAEEALYFSNNEKVAVVSVGGRISAKEVGVTYIFVSISNDKCDMCKVTVIPADSPETTDQPNTTTVSDIILQ